MAKIDPIDRYELRKMVCTACNEMFSDNPCEPQDCPVLASIQSVPTLDVQPVRRGEWEELVWEDEYDNRKRRSYRCRRCYKQNAVRSNFCQHCGADMRKVRTDNV